LNENIFACRVIETDCATLNFQDALRVVFIAEKFNLFAGIKTKRGHPGTEFSISGDFADSLSAMMPYPRQR